MKNALWVSLMIFSTVLCHAACRELRLGEICWDGHGHECRYYGDGSKSCWTESSASIPQATLKCFYAQGTKQKFATIKEDFPEKGKATVTMSNGTPILADFWQQESTKSSGCMSEITVHKYFSFDLGDAGINLSGTFDNGGLPHTRCAGSAAYTSVDYTGSYFHLTRVEGGSGQAITCSYSD